jgi:hypothetical protein
MVGFAFPKVIGYVSNYGIVTQKGFEPMKVSFQIINF